MDEVKINTRNLILGCILMIACVYLGAVSTMPHQTEIITTAINLPLQIAGSKDQISETSISDAINNNEAALNSVQTATDLSELVITVIKLSIIVAIMTIVFFMLSLTGIAPRMGGMS